MMLKRLYSLGFIIPLLMLLVALNAIHIALADYAIGTARNMGTGYFPILISGGIAFVSMLAILEFLLSDTRSSHNLDWRALLMILLSITLFSIVTLFLGLVLGFVVLVAVSVLAQKGFEIKAVVLICVGFSLFTWLVFSVGLELALPLFRWEF